MALAIRTGAAAEPLRLLLHGQEGVGKTTWAARCPNTLFLTNEDGGGDLDYARVVLDSWGGLRDAVAELIDDPGAFHTIVIDTIDGFERLLWQHICQEADVATIELVGGGYGKGYTAAAESMAGLQKDLDRLRQWRRINVILLAHSHVRPFNDPLGAPYDRYEVRMHKGSADLWKAWADAILFACFDVTVMRAGKKGRVVEAGAMEKGKALEGARRMIYTSKEAAYDAKNRHNLPEEIPLDWRAFASAMRWDERDALLRKPAVPLPTADDPHDPSWTNDRTSFIGALSRLHSGDGFTYDEIKTWCLDNKRPKPSAMTAEKRAALLTYLGSKAGRKKVLDFFHRDPKPAEAAAK